MKLKDSESPLINQILPATSEIWLDYLATTPLRHVPDIIIQFSRSLCTMCQFKQSFNRYTLRGLCLDSRHDTVYFLERTPGAMPFFKGLSSSVIRWNQTLNTWVLNHLRYTAPAYLDEDPVVIIQGHLLIGRVSWLDQ